MQIRVCSRNKEAEAIIECMEASGATAISINSAGRAKGGGSAAWELAGSNSDFGQWPSLFITGLYPRDADTESLIRQLKSAVLAEDLSESITVEGLENRDWETAYREHFKPMEVADRLWVCPSWCLPPDPDAENILLDPGLAFGTGKHPTTRLCLQRLASIPITNCDVIDYGCGSGILAIAALKLGAKQAWGIDVDPRAITTSRSNAAKNGVTERYTALSNDAVPVELNADIVIANILSNTLVELASTLHKRVRPNGRLLLSGILTQQLDQVRVYYQDHYRLTEYHIDEWALLEGRRH